MSHAAEVRPGARERISGLWSWKGRYRVLHLTWFAFFVSFVVWFNFAPFAKTIGAQLSLSDAQLTTLALCNVALTVPARIAIGMLLDRFGPRRTYGGLLTFAAVPCLVFATSSSFGVLVTSRLAIGIVGAGFVVGIRMVSEWFGPREIGMAEGVYGGWGNFGSAAAAMTLPTVAAIVGGADGWRWATASTGLIAACYGIVYLRIVSDTPEGVAYQRPQRQGALEVTSPMAVFGLMLITLPLFAALGMLAWQLRRVGFLSLGTVVAVWAVLTGGLLLQWLVIARVNRPALMGHYPATDLYPFRSVAVLCFAYLVTFGSELAVVSMLPTFFADTWGMGAAMAGVTASVFAFTNLFARPAGGLVSDLARSRRTALGVLLMGLAIGYGAMAGIRSTWPVALGMAAVVCCSVFVQSGEGAVFAIVPGVKRRVTGQIAGLVGAYGNVGALLYLTVLLSVGPRGLFVVIACSSVLAAAASRLLVEEPGGVAAEGPALMAEPSSEVA